ncbi:MAG: bifunctional hydroxymethylpyrimidine kinase/phosphomethylpyrimidine kinase [Acidobacteria bacterium RIFCSPLOWO2_02_FULL_67_36]|nr:MAG: bifunctional hydroxymethylpyrimidine kinase/phosphomethylpyrimidine kinase [Acidobacteria bacterium RIFCSPLOWO2_02_FULL_67_36]OFW23949.1 MAG: bifunctional hydroxymethylpyrimidine kinase/phosphomethylpyrimidine kinase [Acidobacteria bacterium RIFCSPLOWO2_12_FULL_66_21]
MRTALTIAGSDSGGGAGIQADLKTFAAHGVYGLTAITAVTAQNTLGVTAWTALSADLVTAQIEAVSGDFGVNAVKTGMLATAAIVEAVAAAIDSLELPLVVVDPVMIAKGGDRLLDEDAVAAMRAELLPRAHMVTPNVPEAEVLAGMRIASIEDMQEAARRILALGPRVVLVKGGHLFNRGSAPDPGSVARGDPSAPLRSLAGAPCAPAVVIDVACSEEGTFEIRGPRHVTRNTHGTGCTLASAIAANLARGLRDREAIERAREYLDGAIRNAPGLGHGHGPLSHFWRTVY